MALFKCVNARICVQKVQHAIESASCTQPVCCPNPSASNDRIVTQSPEVATSPGLCGKATQIAVRLSSPAPLYQSHIIWDRVVRHA